MSDINTWADRSPDSFYGGVSTGEYDLPNVREQTSDVIHTFCNSGRLIDVGTANGQLPFCLNARYNSHNMLGIDIVPEYLSAAKRYAGMRGLAEKCSFRELMLKDAATLFPEKFDGATLLLSMRDILRNESLSDLLEHLSCLLKKNGYFFLVESFPDKAQTPEQMSGITVMEALGYQFPSLPLVLQEMAAQDLRVIQLLDLQVPLPALHGGDLRDYVKRECYFNALAGDSPTDFPAVWDSLSEHAFSDKVEIDTFMTLVVGRREL